MRKKSNLSNRKLFLEPLENRELLSADGLQGLPSVADAEDAVTPFTFAPPSTIPPTGLCL
ncbi:MAG: hypothetical protein IJM30_01670 [Thermoguttaceae bacterium]|nr:hypothetical protein [Thermoguttaceae bacterium]